MVTKSPSLLVAILFSAISFIFFGYSCLTSPFMLAEFKRYGLNKYRHLTGSLQILGSLALLAGLFYLPLIVIGSAGLSVLMFMGLAIRIHLRDSFIKSTPSLFYAVLNLAILLAVLRGLNLFFL
ncbi:DoxX family protein [Croceitalea rosinachiae]|uniref:DoxX family protein n=1 Tax=Croceitalea rosinachiae TaxID=3075596 RepID=A0ABU3A820_9FLAO|nr:DoxX family protein [Croceitalea sp. F388]MDT0606327.1 DoxX family protein [Croceitalea sp. F388]